VDENLNFSKPQYILSLNYKIHPVIEGYAKMKVVYCRIVNQSDHFHFALAGLTNQI